ncbi:MAG: DUF4097 family beta strand repeat-containing protein [Anaerolineae bacterium]
MSEVPERRKNTWLVVVLAALALLLLCACVTALVLALAAPAAFRSVSLPGVGNVLGGRVEVAEEIERSFEVTTPATLEVSSEVGAILIEGGEGEQVTVRAEVRGYGNTTQQAQQAADGVTVTIEQASEGTVRVESTMPSGIIMRLRSPNVTLTITVPRETHLVVRNAVGNVDIRNVSGRLDVTTDVGEIEVSRITLTDDSRLSTNVGEIHIGLPADVAVNLDASTSVGAIRSDFDVAGGEGSRPGASQRLQGAIGTNPTIRLELSTDTGEIRIERE